MSNALKAAITCVGGYVPETKLTNFDLKKWWIPTMSGLEPEQVFQKEEY